MAKKSNIDSKKWLSKLTGIYTCIICKNACDENGFVIYKKNFKSHLYEDSVICISCMLNVYCTTSNEQGDNSAHTT